MAVDDRTIVVVAVAHFRRALRYWVDTSLVYIANRKRLPYSQLRRMYLHILANGSRMLLLAIAAAGLTFRARRLLLIIRQGGRVGCVWPRLIVQDGCIAERSAKHRDRPLQNLVAGQVSPQKYAAHRGCFCGLGGSRGNEA